jgi:hypothetical protein
VLPGRTAAPVERSVPRSYRLAQVTAAVGLVLQPLLPVLVIRAETTSYSTQVSAGVVFALLAAAQAVALLWLRRTPRTSYGVLLGLALLWPVAMATGEYTGPVVLPPALSMLATCAALAADAARTAADPVRTGVDPVRTAVDPVRTAADPVRTAADLASTATDPARKAAGSSPAEDRPRMPRPVLPLAAVAVHAAAAIAAVLDRGTAVPVWAVAACATAGVSLAVAAACWGGAVRGRRELAARGTREERLAAWTEEAVRDAWAERRRIAAGLETTVLARTADMVEQAQAGRLDATAERAREALAVMRALLDTVREGETERELRPQPTLQALDLLAHQCRATGRDIEIRLTDRVPERLPIMVDLAAYHAAEMVLAAGGEEPAVLEFDADDHKLTLTATGVPCAAHPAVRERLAARIAALGGTLTTGPAGTVRLRLPLAPGGAAGADAEGADGGPARGGGPPTCVAPVVEQGHEEERKR